jgi:DHA3 family multidrug efflux protein-like MFS transporter
MRRYLRPIDTDLTPEADQAAKDRAFRGLLLNTLVSGVTGTFVWFALVFWAYLETRSVITTAVIGAAYSLAMAFFGPAFGTFVDRHRKHTAMLLASATSVACFTLATVLFLLVDASSLLSLTGVWFWLLTALVLLGAVAGAMRGIALSTTVSLLVPEERRDKANGLVGTVNGVAFAITSVFSGLVIGGLGMGWALYLSLTFTIVAFLHLLAIRIPEAEPERADGDATGQFDVRGAVDAIKAVPGLGALIALAAFNNLLGGVFMALMDAYGLELVSVETWGLLWGFIMLAFIAGGIGVARFGLGRTPVKLIVTCNLVNWVICSVFAVQSSIPLLTVGCFVWLLMMPVIEAAEQTVLQRAIPFEKQGRVFGFAQMVENAASPVTSIVIGPLAAEIFIPWMTGGSGADWIGSWWGIGPERGLAVMFTLAGLIGVVVTLLFRASRSYRRLTTIRVEDDAELAVAAA